MLKCFVVIYLFIFFFKAIIGSSGHLIWWYVSIFTLHEINMPSTKLHLAVIYSGMRTTFNKQAENLVKKVQNILKRKEHAKVLTKKQEFLLFPENSHTCNY